MFESEMKLAAELGVYERMEISGVEASTAIGCYPAMKIVEHRIIDSGKEIYVVDYPEKLTAELVQALADKWNLTIIWRRQGFFGK